MHDPNGNLLFFINDGTVYDRHGILIGQVITQNSLVMNGTTEFTIIPVPNHCTQYYLIGAAVDLSQAGGAPTPYYIVLDLSLINGNTNSQGDFIGSDNNGNPLIGSTVAFPLIDPQLQLPSGTYYGLYLSAQGFSCNMHFAATPLRTDGTRFLYINNLVGGCIDRFHVTSNGITYDATDPNSTYVQGNADFHGQTRAEMEIVQLASPAVNYRIAVPYSRLVNNVGDNAVFVADIDYNTGDIIPATIKYLTLPTVVTSSGSNVAQPHGLEFSSSSRFLYVTHTQPPYIEFADLSVANPTFSELKLVIANPNGMPHPEDFQYSQIEMGNDGNLYFAGNDDPIDNNPRLASLNINFFNSPVGATWNDNAIPNFTVPISDDGLSATQAVIGDIAYVRLLNDQVDGEIYQNYPTSTLSTCCLANSVFTKDTYVATTSTLFPTKTQTWTPTHNPFGGTQANPVSTVTIKTLLEIPKGFSINIFGMTFQFVPRINSPATPGAELVIDRGDANNHGGKLVLNNSTLTSYDGCGVGMWEGVEVQGDPSQPQGVALNSRQGWLILQGTATISNAYTGVLVGKRATPFPNISEDQTFDGGVVRAVNSSFINNQIGVAFYPYTNMLNPLNNSSFFTLCHFTTSLQTLNDPNITFSGFAFMFGTAGITFNGNNFINNNITNILTIATNGYGIYGIDANFQVLSTCANPPLCTQTAPNTFRNLANGVVAFMTNPINSVKIDGSNFINDYNGILLRNVAYSTVTNNTFRIVKGNFAISPGAAYGIFLDNSTNYQVEANDFAYSTLPPNGAGIGNTYGIVVSNSGHNNNLVYRNTFHQIYIGCQAQRVNCLPIQNANPQNPTGLKWYCNTFNNQLVDKYDIVEPNGCENYYQGQDPALCMTSTCPANNSFSHTNNSVHYNYYLNPSTTTDPYTGLTNGVPVISYIYPNGASYNPAPDYTFTKISAVNNPVTPTCPSEILVGCPSCQKTTIASDQQEITMLNGEIDGGSTATLLADISGNMTALQLRNTLVSASPYLSDQVLIAYINKPNVPALGIRDVLLANSPLRPDVLTAYHVIAPTLPPAIRISIANAQHGLSPLSALYGEIAEVQADKDFAVNELIRDYLFDTTLTHGLDSVELALKIYGETLGDKYKIAGTQTAKGDFTSANATLDTISAMNNNSLDNAERMLRILIRLEQSPNGRFSLRTDTSFAPDSVSVSQIAGDTLDEGFIGAQAMMKVVFAIEHREVIDQIQNSSSTRMANPDQEEMPIEEGKIYPNPNNGTMMFSYEIPEQSKGVLILYDISGKQVDSFILREGQNTAQINDENLEAGIYFYRFVIDDEQVNSGKFVIVK